MVPHRKQLRRWNHPGHARYLTFSCYQRLPLLKNDKIKALLRDEITAAHARHTFALYAWVIMPEHVHLLLKPTAVPVATILRDLKRNVARSVLDRWRQLQTPVLARITDTQGIAHFWQPGGGYDRNLTDASDIIKVVEYIHGNPIRRSLTKTNVEWPWSSARWYAGERSMSPPIDPIE